MLYTAGPQRHLLLARTVAYAAAYAGLTFTIQLMTHRLAAAEARQRLMAHETPDRPAEPAGVRPRAGPGV